MLKSLYVDFTVTVPPDSNPLNPICCKFLHSNFIYIFIYLFGLFQGCGIWKFPGKGLNQSCCYQPTPQPQQHWILNPLSEARNRTINLTVAVRSQCISFSTIFLSGTHLVHASPSVVINSCCGPVPTVWLRLPAPAAPFVESKIMASKDIQVSIPRNCDYFTIEVRGIKVVNQLGSK